MRIGGRGRDRTGDPLLAKQVLSQLSYTPILATFIILRHFRISRIPLWTTVRKNFAAEGTITESRLHGRVTNEQGNVYNHARQGKPGWRRSSKQHCAYNVRYGEPADSDAKRRVQ